MLHPPKPAGFSRKQLLYAALLFQLGILSSLSGCGGGGDSDDDPGDDEPDPGPITSENSTPRTLTFVNNCPFPVSIGAVGGNAGDCDANNQCGPGRACSDVVKDGKRQCHWILQEPDKTFGAGDWQLAAAGSPATNTARITVLAAEYRVVAADGSTVSVQWSGSVFGRFGCQVNSAGKFICDSGDCNSPIGDQACAVATGGTPPVTQAEFTLQNDREDVYDVEIINGPNIPVEMAPVAPFKPDGGGDYWCGNPGSPQPSNPRLSPCTWAFAPPAPDYQFVSQNGSGQVCLDDSACAGAEKCGLTIPAVAPDPADGSQRPVPLGQKRCGPLLGYWSADQICGLNPQFGPPFNCNTQVPSGPYGTLANLYGCVVPDAAAEGGKKAAESCYSSNPPASDTCCGCSNWEVVNGGVPLPTATACQNFNPLWVDNVLPKITFLKQACPTVYTYPYDDETSTFRCVTEDVPNTPNHVNYTITYCPGGLTGGVTSLNGRF